jgi:hypothetical protein
MIVTYIFHNPYPIADFKHCLTQMLTIVCSVHLNKTDKSVFECPFAFFTLLDPMSRDSEVCVCVRCLPSVACEADAAYYIATLKHINISQSEYL